MIRTSHPEITRDLLIGRETTLETTTTVQVDLVSVEDGKVGVTVIVIRITIAAALILGTRWEGVEGDLGDTARLKITNRGLGTSMAVELVGVALTMVDTPTGTFMEVMNRKVVVEVVQRMSLGDYKRGYLFFPLQRSRSVTIWTNSTTQPLLLGISRKWKNGRERRMRQKVPPQVRHLWTPKQLNLVKM